MGKRQTKYAQIAALLEDGIRGGTYRAGQPLPSVRKLMVAHGLSMSTVVRGLKLLQERNLLECHPQRGYFVAGPSIAKAAADPGAASALTTVRRRMAPATAVRQIAFVTPALSEDTNCYLRGMSEPLDGQDATLATFSAQADLTRYHNLLNQVAALRPAGVVLHAIPRDIVRLDDTLLFRSRIPVVLIGTPLRGIAADRVFVSGYDAGAKIARHLLDKGIRDVAVLEDDPQGDEFKQELVQGLTSGLKRNEVELPPERIFQYHNTHGYADPPAPMLDPQAFVASLLRQGHRFRALVCTHDYPAVGALRALRAAGLRVPEDVAVVSAHRCAGMGVEQAGLTTFDSHREEQAWRAVQLLLRRIGGHAGPLEVHFVSGDLVPGETT